MQTQLRGLNPISEVNPIFFFAMGLEEELAAFEAEIARVEGNEERPKVRTKMPPNEWM